MKVVKFCRACGHIPIAKIVEETIQRTKGVFICGVGCSVSLATDFEDVDAISMPHGRTLTGATAARRVFGDDKVIIAYQGDGDCLTIGIGELVNTILRNEPIVCILINNQQFGMTGHQMSAATPLEMQTKTCFPRSEENHGIPIHVGKLIRALNPKVKFYRVHAAGRDNIHGIDAFRNYLDEAIKNDGFSLIEVISPCPTFFNGKIKESYEFAKKHYNKLTLEDTEAI